MDDPPAYLGPQAAPHWAVPDDLIRVLLDEESGGNLPSEQEVIRCRECVADFLADDDSGESVSFQFDKGDTVYRFESKD